MGKAVVLYNPYAGSGRGTEESQKLKDILKDTELQFFDVTKITDYVSFWKEIPGEWDVILSGGDGTLNHFINDAGALDSSRKIYYYASGSGNDFLHDIGRKKGDAPVLINRYLENLPEVMVDGKTCRFLNGIGYGIDGYCCEVGDAQRLKSDKPVNYTAIAIKGLLFHYKPTSAVITVDGVKHTYKKVWLAPTMNGRFYGGGFNPVPEAEPDDGLLDVLIVEKVNLLQVAGVIGKYQKGHYADYPHLIRHVRCHTVRVECEQENVVNVDGEAVYTTDAKIEVVPHAIRFFYPKGLSYHAKNSQSGHKFAEITP